MCWMVPVKVDPDFFRVQVGQYHDRWYHDPLPACDIATADPEWRAPSVSTIKKASGKDWTNASVSRIAGWMFEEQPTWEDYQPRDIAQRLNEINQAGLGTAFQRGNEIHAMMEAYADGEDPEQLELGPYAQPYRETTLRLIRRERPVVAMDEFVCLSRTHGYGGTSDALWVIDGQYWLVDYKTRTEKHTVYQEEAWQGAAYSRADYWVMIGPDGVPVRYEPIPVAGGLIVSITPDGYRIREFDIDRAFDQFLDLRRLWAIKAAGIKSVFGGWLEPRPLTRDLWIRERITALKAVGLGPLLQIWPEEVPKPKKIDVYSDFHINALLTPLAQAEKLASMPFPEPDPGAPPLVPRDRSYVDDPDIPPIQGKATETPAEGDEMPSALEAISRRFGNLKQTQIDWANARAKEAAEAGVPFRVADMPSARRIFISRAMILACERRISTCSFRTALESLAPIPPSLATLGALLGSLDWEQASVLAGLISMTGPAESDEPYISLEEEHFAYDVLTKDKLKEQCRDRSLPVGGSKTDLIERLLDADNQQKETQT